MKQHKLNELKRVLKDREQTIQSIAMLQAASKQQKNRILQLEQELKEPVVQDLKVTDHALLRFLERTLEYNVSEWYRNILANLNTQQIEELGGNGDFPSIDGEFIARIRNNKIITILNPE